MTEPDAKVDSLTQTGAMLGTPAYMPLEQFGRGSIDARSDQFGFCVALHEALYGERPFAGETLGELMGELLRGEVRVVTGRGIAVPSWVRAVVLRGLATRPEDRFSSMQALLDALAADPVARRRRIAMRLGLGVAFVAASWALLTLSDEVEQRDAKIEAQENELEVKNTELEQQLAAQTHLLSVQRGLRASMLVDTEHEGEALLMGVQAVGAYAAAWDEAPPEAVAGLEKVLAHDPIIVAASQILRDHEDYVTHVAYSPDGARLASSSHDGTVRIWDPVRARLLSTLADHEGQVFHLAFSPQSARIATTSTDGKARIWDVESGERLVTLAGHEAPLHTLAFSPDGTRLATAGRERSVRVWDAQTGALLLTLEGDTRHMTIDLAFSPDGTRLVTGGTDAEARVWDATTGAVIATLEGHEGPILDVEIAPDGTQVATASIDRHARLWTLETGELVATLEGHRERVSRVAYRPDGKRVVTGSWDSEGRVYDAATGKLVTTLEGGHRAGVVYLAYAPDGSSVATSSYEGNVALWDPETGKLRARLRGHKGDVWSLAFAPSGRQLASASVDHSVRLWELDETRVEVLEGPESNARAYSYLPEQEILATVSMDGRLRLWRYGTGELMHALDDGDEGAQRSLFMSPDGTTLASRSPQTLSIWDVETGVLRASTALHDLEGGASYLPSGTLIQLEDDTRTTIFDARTLERLATIEHGPFRSKSYSPDDSRMAIATGTSTVELWETRAGVVAGTLEAPEGKLHRVAFSPDGTRIATCSDRSGVRIWDARSLSLHTTFAKLPGLNRLVYTRDGTQLVGGGGTVGVVVWDVQTGEIVTRIEPGALETGTGFISVSADGRRIIISGSGYLRVHDTATGERLVALDHSLDPHVTFSADGTRFMGIGPDHVLEVRLTDTGKLLTRERVGAVHEDGSSVWPIPRRALTRIGCARLRVFVDAYPEA
ncbi:MAG: PD40 domain-containing protein, partial [Myxococcales bacterium]|nr:PD40 domain-containing protein [Myxococcales bacterium]